MIAFPPHLPVAPCQLVPRVQSLASQAGVSQSGFLGSFLSTVGLE